MQLRLAHSPRASLVLLAVYVVSMPVYCLVRVSGHATWIGLSTAFTAASLFAFSLAHCIETRGTRRSLLMLLSAFAITFTMEYLGSVHDVLFGVYDYTSLLGPRLLDAVPIIIPIAWFMMLYPAWEVAGLITAHWPMVGGRGSVWLRILMAALAMTAWDLSLDPRMVADGAWKFFNVPALNYFGIPLSNFIGWIVTSALIYLVWSRLESAEHSAGAFRTLHSQLPIWAYIITWIGESMANALFWSGPAVAAFVFVGMGLFGAPAVWLLVRGQRPARAGVAPAPAR